MLEIIVKETTTGKKHLATVEKVRVCLQTIWDEKMDLAGSWRIILSFGSLADNALASTTCEWAYRIAHMKFDLVRLSQQGGEPEIYLACVHELLHLPVWQYGEVSQALAPTAETRELLRNFEESLVNTFERMPAFQKGTV